MAGEIPETSVYSAAVDCLSRRGLERGGPFRTVREPDGKPAALHYKLLQSDLNRHPVRCNRADYSCLGVQEPYYGGAFSALLFNMSMDMAASARRKTVKAALYALALVTLIHIFVMLQSRTAQLITILLTLYQTYRLARPERSPPEHFSASSYDEREATPCKPLKNALERRALWRACIFGVSCAFLIGALIYLKGSRLTQMGAEIAAYQQRNEATSAGLRIEWTRKSLVLFAQRPLFGYGVASIRREFEKMNAGNEGARGAITANPHNQYLLMAAELGLLGLGLLICLLIQIARAAARLAAPARHLLGCWLFIFAAGCLANSLLLDFSEGYLLVLLSGILLGCAGCSRNPSTNCGEKPYGERIAAPCKSLKNAL